MRDALALELPSFTTAGGIALHASLGGYALCDHEVRVLTALIDLRPTRAGKESIVHALHLMAEGLAEHQGQYRDSHAATDELHALLQQIEGCASVHLILVLPEYSLITDTDVRRVLNSLADLGPHKLEAAVGIAANTPQWSAVEGLRFFVTAQNAERLPRAAQNLFAVFQSLAAPKAFGELDVHDLLANTGSAAEPGRIGYALVDEERVREWQLNNDQPQDGVLCPVAPIVSMAMWNAIERNWLRDIGGQFAVTCPRAFWTQQRSRNGSTVVVLYKHRAEK